MNEESDPLDDDIIPSDWDEPTRKPRPRLRLPMLLVAGAIGIVLFLGWVDLYTDWLWFPSVGFQTVFSTILTTMIAFALVSGLAAAAIAYTNLRLALRLAPGVPFGRRFVKIEGQS